MDRFGEHRFRDGESGDLHAGERPAGVDRHPVGKGEHGDAVHLVDRLQGGAVDAQQSARRRAEPHLGLNRCVAGYAATGDRLGQTLRGCVLVDVAVVEPEHVKLVGVSGAQRLQIVRYQPVALVERGASVLPADVATEQRTHPSLRLVIDSRARNRLRPHRTTPAGFADMAPPLRPRRDATISARIAMAISAGVEAPRSSPTRLWMRAMASSANPASCSRATLLACVDLLPIAPILPTLEGSIAIRD